MRVCSIIETPLSIIHWILDDHKVDRQMCRYSYFLMRQMCRYSYCSLSNILSSWCQYEALKYISFPTQVLWANSEVFSTLVL